MSRVLIIAEHDGKSLNVATARCVSCAQAIGGETHIAAAISDSAGGQP